MRSLASDVLGVVMLAFDREGVHAPLGLRPRGRMLGDAGCFLTHYEQKPLQTQCLIRTTLATERSRSNSISRSTLQRRSCALSNGLRGRFSK
jgi:hypothetical protein